MGMLDFDPHSDCVQIRWGESGSELAAADTDANGQVYICDQCSICLPIKAVQVDAEELARSDLSDAAIDFYKDADDHVSSVRVQDVLTRCAA